MPDIYFKCSCGKNLAVDQQGIGQVISCPDCGGDIEIPPADLSWKCQECDEELSAPTSLIGDTVQCLNCRSTVEVPAPGMMDVLPVAASAVAEKSTALLRKVTEKIASKALTATTSSASAGFCSKCGTAHETDAAFCSKCGDPLKSMPAPAGARKRPVPTVKGSPAKPKKKRKNLNIPFGKLAFAAAVIAIVGGAWILRQDCMDAYRVHLKPLITDFMQTRQVASTRTQTGDSRLPDTIAKASPDNSSTPHDHELSDDATGYLFEDETTGPDEAKGQAKPTEEHDKSVDNPQRQAEKAFLAGKPERDKTRKQLISVLTELKKEAAKYNDVEPGDFTSLNGTRYTKVRIKSVFPDGISIMHSAGVAKVPFTELPHTIRNKYKYDTEHAALYARAASETMELKKVMEALDDSTGYTNAIPVLVKAMSQNKAAINMNQADTMLDGFFSMRKADEQIEKTMELVEMLEPREAIIALNSVVTNYPNAPKREDAIRMISALNRDLKTSNNDHAQVKN